VVLVPIIFINLSHEHADCSGWIGIVRPLKNNLIRDILLRFFIVRMENTRSLMSRELIRDTLLRFSISTIFFNSDDENELLIDFILLFLQTCGKSFVVKHYYIAHKASHEEEKASGADKLKCDICLKTYNTDVELEQHKRRHKNTKVFKAKTKSQVCF